MLSKRLQRLVTLSADAHPTARTGQGLHARIALAAVWGSHPENEFWS